MPKFISIGPTYIFISCSPFNFYYIYFLCSILWHFDVNSLNLNVGSTINFCYKFSLYCCYCCFLLYCYNYILGIFNFYILFKYRCFYLNFSIFCSFYYNSSYVILLLFFIFWLIVLTYANTFIGISKHLFTLKYKIFVNTPL